MESSSPSMETASTSSSELLWEPHPDEVAQSNLMRYLQWLEEERGLKFDDYGKLWEWSVNDLEDFWSSMGEYFVVWLHRCPERVLSYLAWP